MVTKNRMLISPQVGEVLNSIATANEITVPAALRMLVKAYVRGDFRLGVDDLPIAPKPGDPNAPILFDGEPGITVRDPGPVCLRFLNFMVKQALARKDSAEYKPLGWLIEILNANLDRMTTKDGTRYAPLTLPTYEEFTKPKPVAAPLPVRYEGLATASKSPTKTLDADWLENLDLDAEFGKM